MEKWTLRTAPGLTLLRTLQRMRPLRRARQKSSSEGVAVRDNDATLSIWRSHSVALYLLQASTIQQKPNHLHHKIRSPKRLNYVKGVIGSHQKHREWLYYVKIIKQKS